MKLLMSACLLGVNCRYNGERKALPDDVLQRLLERHTVVPVCPEQLGGLTTPREPSERQGERVVMRSGRDVTAEYTRGAQEALRLARRFGCTAAVLKERSPSCGMGKIYDGSFQGRIVDGNGVTAQLLAAHGISVYGESRIHELLSALENNT